MLETFFLVCYYSELGGKGVLFVGELGVLIFEVSKELLCIGLFMVFYGELVLEIFEFLLDVF